MALTSTLVQACVDHGLAVRRRDVYQRVQVLLTLHSTEDTRQGYVLCL
jgi:hypothetical protein